MKFTFSLAAPTDDPDLRQLLANNPVPGHISLTYRREPDYFAGCSVMGQPCQIIVARHSNSGQIAALLSRSTRPLFVNGVSQKVGYLSQLRIDHRFQGRWLLPQGARFLRQLHADDPAGGYLATIIQGSRQAAGVLIDHPRKSYPTFRPVCRLTTLAIILRRQQATFSRDYIIRRGSVADLPEIADFLQQYGAARQFFPVYTPADFDNSPLTRDFKPADFFMAYHNQTLMGVMGLWDQSAYKQTVVQAYSGSLDRLHPLYNWGLAAIGAKPLPAPGGTIHAAYASFIAVIPHYPAVFDLLLCHLCNEAGSRGFAYLMLGLTDADPLLPLARRRLHIPYYSHLYTAGWEESLAWHTSLDDRTPYLELAAM